MDFFDTTVTPQAFSFVEECLRSGRLSEGEWVLQLEQELERQFGYENCVAVNSCTSALHLALVLAGVGEGDEVILPAQTFVATGLAVLYTDAKPIFTDIHPWTGNIDPERITIAPRTKAIIAVSWGGNPCDLMSLQKICQENNLVLIQDNAQALGATYMGEPISNWGDFSCFSFQAIKHLTAGDGGLLVSNGDGYVKARKLRWFGIDRELDLPDETGERQYNLDETGYKYHMNNVAAAIGLGNLYGVKDRILKRKQIAKFYDQNIPKELQIVRYVGSSNWLYTILVERRDDFIRMMKSKEIPVSVVHNGIDRNKVFGKWDLPVQRQWDEHHVCLPIHPSLTEEDMARIVGAVNGGW